MTWHLFPRPQGTGGGGGAGLDDVTGTPPIYVDSFGTDRNVRIDPTQVTIGSYVDRGMLPRPGRQRVSWLVPLNDTTAQDALEWAPFAPGAAVAISNTSFYESGVRQRYTTASLVDKDAGANLNSAGFGHAHAFRGDPVGAGGYLLEMVVGFHALNSDSRCFVGIFRTAANGTGALEVSTKTSQVGMGLDSTDTNLQLMHNDNAGTCTKIDMGADFPRPTVDVDVYYVQLFCEPAGDSIEFLVQKLNDTSKVFSHTISSDMPARTLVSVPQFYVNTGPTSGTAASIDYFRGFGVTFL